MHARHRFPRPSHVEGAPRGASGVSSGGGEGLTPLSPPPLTLSSSFEPHSNSPPLSTPSPFQTPSLLNPPLSLPPFTFTFNFLSPSPGVSRKKGKQEEGGGGHPGGGAGFLSGRGGGLKNAGGLVEQPNDETPEALPGNRALTFHGSG